MNDEVPLRIRTRLKIFRGMPNFVPFLSVFFLLLIFFMIGSSFVQVSGIPVELPTAPVRGSFSARKFVVTLDKSGSIYFNDFLLPDMDRFKTKLMETVNASREPTTIILRADASVPYGKTAAVMSAAEEMKVNVFLLTAPPSEKNTVRQYHEAE